MQYQYIIIKRTTTSCHNMASLHLKSQSAVKLNRWLPIIKSFSVQLSIINIAMSSSILRYGQVIRIRSYQKQNTFITSKSYTDPNLYFQIYDKDSHFFTYKDHLNISNYRESLFQVLPTSSFEINDEMNSQKVEAKKAESAPRAKTEEEQFKTIINEKRSNNISFGDRVVFRHVDSQYYIYGSFDCATSGIGAFKIQLKKQLSEKIIFQLIAYRTYEKEGDQISITAPFSIYHCQTQCYVSYCFEELFLDRVHDKEIFKGRLAQEDPMFPVDPPKIKQFFKERDDENVDWANQLQTTTLRLKNNELMVKKGRYLLINQNIPKRVFKLVKHNQFQMKINRQQIRNHDIVYFTHTEDDQYIVPDNFGSQIFLKKKLSQPDQIDIFDGLWEIEQIKTLDEKSEDVSIGRSKSPSRKDATKKFGNTLGINLNTTYLKKTMNKTIQDGQLRAGFTPSSDDNQDENDKNNSNKYIIRHLASGRIMYISETQRAVELQNDPYCDKMALLLQLVDSKLEDGSLVKFTYKKRIVNSNEIVKLMLSKVKKGSLKEQQKQLQQSDRIYEVQEVESEKSIMEQQGGRQNAFGAYNNKFQMDYLRIVSDDSQHGFRVYKISEQVKQLCLFVLSSQELISKFTSLIHSYKHLKDLLEELTVFLLNNVMNVFKNLIGFIYDCDFNKIAQSGNNPIAKRQRIFDQLGMIELTTRMLQIIHKRDFEQGQFLNQLEKINKSSQYRKIRNIYELGYKLLQSVAAGNDLLKARISRYLKKYLHQINTKENRIVYKSIQEVLEGNQQALQDIKEQFIQKLIQNLDKNDPDPADLYFLSRLCLCRQRTVHKNQVAIFKSFYEEKVQKSKVRSSKYKGEEELAANKFQFREDQEKMQILSIIVPPAQPQFRTLSQLFDQCNLMKSQGGYNPDKNHWSYFMQYLNLLADLCVQRNPYPLVYVQENLPLKTLVAFLHETTVKKNLLFQPFIRLVHHAFVQNSDYQQISRITKVKHWSKLNKSHQIPKAQREIDPELKKTMALIFDYIKRINKKSFERKKGVVQTVIKPATNGADDSSQAQPQTIDLDFDDKDRLINVKTFLEILKSTLNLGFWPQISQMKLIIPYLLKILRFDIEYSDRAVQLLRQQDKKTDFFRFPDQQYKPYVYNLVKQQLKLNKPNIVLLVECKILVARILNIIIDYQFNMRVSIITRHFKDVMEVDVDLSKYVPDKIQFIKKWNKHQQYQLFAPSNKKESYLLICQLWQDKVNEILDQRDLFSECKAQKINPKLVFFEAFIYSNQELTNLTLNLINRITNQREQILKTFKDIIFVAGGVLQTLAVQSVETTRSILLNLTNQTIRQPLDSNKYILWKSTSNQEKKQGIKHGVIQQFAQLTMSMMKKGNPFYDLQNFYSINDLYPFYDPIKYARREEKQEKDGSFMIITEKDINLPLNQNLIKSQDHHNLIIFKFIQNMREVPTDFQLSMRALHASYNFLTVLIWNNNQNKKQLQGFLKLAESHLQYNVGCIDFFKQMYTNNKKLVKNGDIKSILQQVINYANQTKINLYQKSKLLDFLRIAAIFDDKGYDVNQNMVMEFISQYQVSSNNQIVYLPEQQKKPNTISITIKQGYDKWMAQYVTNYENSVKDYSDLNIPAQIMYVATFFEIFSALIENENIVNIGKASNMHPLQFLYKILQRSHKCWIVIRHLRSYLNKLYYFQKRVRDSKLFQAFVIEAINDLDIIRTELSDIAELICNAPQYNMIRLKNPVRYTYLGSYVYLSLQQILHSLDLFIREYKDKKDFQNFLSSIINQQHPKKKATVDTILEIIQYLEYLRKTIDGRYINKYMSKVIKRLRYFVSNIPYNDALIYSEESKKKMAKNIADNQLNSDQIPFKKSYKFHEGKGFWRHLIDWNSFKQQQVQRQKELNKVSKRVQSLPNQTPQALTSRRRDYLLDVIFLGNIDKRLQKKKEEGKKVNKSQAPKDIKSQNKQLQSSLPKNLTTSQSARFDVKKQKFLSFDEQNIVINNRRKKLVKFLEINEAFKEYSQEQVEKNLYDVFASLRQISAERYGLGPEDKTQVVGCEEVIQSIVKMNQLDPNSIKYEYKLLIIRLLTNFIQRTSNIFKNDIKNWVIQETQERPQAKQKAQTDRKNIKKAQNFLHRCGVASFLSSLIVNDLKHSIQMGNAILLFGITLLWGSSTQIQSQLFQLIKKDESNLLLSQVSILIKDCGSSIGMVNTRGEVKQFGSKTMNYSDTYDYYIDTEKIMKRQFFYQPQTVLQQKEFDQKVINMQYAFIFLKNFCQNENRIKEFIHQQTILEQDNKLKAQSVDFLNLSIVELKRMFTNFNISIIKVPFAIIDFIYEVTQIPCLKNQEFICKSTLFTDFAQLQVNIINLIEQKGKKNPSEEQKIILQINLATIFELYSANIKTVISCLQGNIDEIYKSLSQEALAVYFVKVLTFYKEYLPILINCPKIQSAAVLATLLNQHQRHEKYFMDMFQSTSVIVKLLTKKEIVGDFQKKVNIQLQKSKMQDIFQLLKQNLLGIQIKGEQSDDVKNPYQTLFFPKHNVFRYLSRSTRTNVMQEVDRSTQRDKIIGLFSQKELITDQIEYNYKLDNQYKLFDKIPLSITTAKIETYMSRGLSMAVIICLLMLYFASVVYYPYAQTIQYDLGKQQIVLKIASILQFIIAMTYFFLWIKSHLELAVKKYQREKESKKQQGQEIQSKLMTFLFKIPGFKSFYCLKEDGQFGNMMLFMFGSLMGIFYKIQWYSLLLMNLLMARLDVLRNIITALKVSLKMLGILSVFGVSFITFFSVFSMSYYAQSIYPDRYPDQHCERVYECVVELYINQQIGQDMEVFKPGRFIYDMIYVVFMDMLFGNILGGVLIDNFASLRSQREDMLKDKTQKCFICGINRQALQKKSQDLKSHYTKQYHKLWNYVFYLYYLQKQTKKTGLQLQILRKSNSQDVSWIPVATEAQDNVGDLLIRLEQLIKQQEQSIAGLQTKE